MFVVALAPTDCLRRLAGPVGAVPICAVCSQDNDGTERHVSVCGHGFCSACWRGLPGSRGTDFSCPADKSGGVCGCNIAANSVVVMRRRKCNGVVEKDHILENGLVLKAPVQLVPKNHMHMGEKAELYSLELKAPKRQGPRRKTRSELERSVKRAEEEVSANAERAELNAGLSRQAKKERDEAQQERDEALDELKKLMSECQALQGEREAALDDVADALGIAEAAAQERDNAVAEVHRKSEVTRV